MASTPDARRGTTPARGDALQVITESHWSALQWFAVSRLAVALGLWIASITSTSIDLLEIRDLSNFRTIALIYAVLALTYLVTIGALRPRFQLQLHAHVTTDLLALTALVWASGGVRGGIGTLIIASVAAAAVLATPRVAAGFAAAGALLLLGETAWRALDGGIEPAAFAQAGMIGAACFLVGLAVNWLSSRLQLQEELAWRRGQDLSNQLAVTQRVIAELQQGVMVVSAEELSAHHESLAQSCCPPNWWSGWVSMAARRHSSACVRPTGARLPMPTGAGVHQSRTGVHEMVFSPEPEAEGEAATRLRLRFVSARETEDSDAVILIEDLREVENRAQQLKLASMGRLSASIAHEIRNPLGAIRHANSLLAEQLGSPQLQRLARIVEDNTVRINRTIEDVLSISRRDRAVDEAVDMSTFLPAFVRDIQLQASTSARRIGLSVRTSKPMRFDSNHLRQVLSNLVGNALRYASELPAAVIVEWVETPDHRLELRIADDGPGLSVESLQHAFEPLYKTESRGTGLGLYLARELCSVNGASIRYQRAQAGSRYSGGFVIEVRADAPGAGASGQ
ncbi:MAG: HAMP domain-containing sensor histidine kinase [Burkholderiaceae bacterium]